MSRTAWLIIAILMLVLLGAGLYYWLNSSASPADLTSFTVQKPNLVAEGKNLGKVEIWAIPTGTNVSTSSYQKLGDAAESGTNDDLQIWTMPIPSSPVSATQIYAKGYGPNGEDAGEIFLPYVGATNLYDVLWGNAPGPSSTSTAENVPPTDCGGCVGEKDNGRTMTVGETSRITIELPAAKYRENSLTITPALMGETFGASSAPSYWVRTFEAAQPGTAVIKVLGTSSSILPWTLTVKITGPQ